MSIVASSEALKEQESLVVEERELVVLAICRALQVLTTNRISFAQMGKALLSSLKLEPFIGSRHCTCVYCKSVGRVEIFLCICLCLFNFII